MGFLYMEAQSGFNFELVLGQPIPDGGDVNLDWTLAPLMVDDQPAPPLVGNQQAPVVAEVYPERGELESIIQRPHPRGEFSVEQQAALNERATAHLSQKTRIINIMQSLYPDDNWENSKSIREWIFVASGVCGNLSRKPGKKIFLSGTKRKEEPLG